VSPLRWYSNVLFDIASNGKGIFPRNTAMRFMAYVCVCVWQPILFDVVAYFLQWILILILILTPSLFCGEVERDNERKREFSVL
jgi:hypothetical protein